MLTKSEICQRKNIWLRLDTSDDKSKLQISHHLKDFSIEITFIGEKKDDKFSMAPKINICTFYLFKKMPMR